MTTPSEPTLAQQIRSAFSDTPLQADKLDLVEQAAARLEERERDGEFQRVPNALLEQTNARIDELEQQVEKWKESAQILAQEKGQAIADWQSVQRQLAAADVELANVTYGQAAAQRERIIAQAERERCAQMSSDMQSDDPVPGDWNAACQDICEKIRALAPRTGEEPAAKS